MLILFREAGEKIYIGDDICLTVRTVLDGQAIAIEVNGPDMLLVCEEERYKAAPAHTDVGG